MPEPLLEVSALTKSYPDPVSRRRRTVLAGIGFRLEEAAGLGVMGPSGSGKSTLARLLVGLERPDSGVIRLHGRDVDLSRRSERRRLRRAVQIVWQDPLLHLNPYLTVRRSLAEALQVAGAAENDPKDLCEAVHLPVSLLERRPSELSGGEAQRLVLARALAVQPQVLVCDEALSGLDLPVQRHVIELLQELRRSRKFALVCISHDVLPLALLCDEIAVLWQGSFVESAAPAPIRRFPRHPMTRALVARAFPGGIG